MAIYRDPATGLMRSDNQPAGVTLPARTPAATQPIAQLPVRQSAPPTETRREAPNLGRSILRAPGMLAEDMWWLITDDNMGSEYKVERSFLPPSFY